MVLRMLTAALAFGSTAALGGDNEDIILPPIYEGEDLPERLLVFLPGAKVPTENYSLTMEAVQKATTGVRLTVVIPAMTGKLCILQCFSQSKCGQLKRSVDKAINKSSFPGKNPKEDTFVAGHSMGSICANQMVAGHGYEYAGLMAYGGYVDETGESSLDNYSIPVLTMAGELDGGGARPGKLSKYYEQFKKHAIADIDVALTRKPVQVLAGMDHSDFCPGFFVTAIKDLKSEVSQEVSLAMIGNASSAFLQLNSPTSDDTKKAALRSMHKMLDFTSKVLEPYLTAFSLAQSGSTGPWCKIAQRTMSGLNSTDANKLVVNVDAVPASKFEHQHTNYSKLVDGTLQLRVISAVEPSTGFGPKDIHGAAKSIDCKMVSAERIGEQLGVATQEVACAEMNKVAVEKARQLMPEHSLKRFDATGRNFSYQDDHGVFANIGPLFLKGSIKLNETSESLEISSVSLLSSTKSKIFPGNRYCKFLSPAMAMEWMMTDGLKPFPYNLEGDDAAEEIVV